MDKITSFRSEYRFLSNFTPVNILFEGEIYPSVKHAYQAAKTILPSQREKIRLDANPVNAKRSGKKVTLRFDWTDSLKLGLMKDFCTQKFNTPKYKALLLSTGDKELIEGNEWGDFFWGECRGRGHNHLGKILMEIRKSLLVSPT